MKPVSHINPIEMAPIVTIDTAVIAPQRDRRWNPEGTSFAGLEVEGSGADSMSKQQRDHFPSIAPKQLQNREGFGKRVVLRKKPECE
jgi:hypothetical protein